MDSTGVTVNETANDYYGRILKQMKDGVDSKIFMSRLRRKSLFLRASSAYAPTHPPYSNDF
jgi:hypothetical protein